MNDVIQYQRLASGYIPGLSEAGHPAPSAPPVLGPGFGQSAPSSAQLQNCIVVRPVAAGIYDIIVGASNPAPEGIGGTLFGNPPIVAPATPVRVVQQGRVSVNIRSVIQAGGAPPTAVAMVPSADCAIWYGDELPPASPPLYNGIPNSRVVRLVFTSGGALVDVDCDFSIERVIDTGSEP